VSSNAYLILGAVAIFLAILILRTKFPAVRANMRAARRPGHFSELFRYPISCGQLGGAVLYVGAQVGTWTISSVRSNQLSPNKLMSAT